MAVRVGSARIDENGKAYGGKAGDQTGNEVSTQDWYLHKKGWRVFRAKDPAVAEKIAAAMEAACRNNNIGYDQYQRNTLYTQAQKVDFVITKVTTPCETDCSALVRVCCAYAGILGLPSDFRTVNMPANLMKTGAFIELKGDKYQTKGAYLGRGDILVTKTSGHTVVVLTNGKKYEGSPVEKEYELGDRTLKHGCEGADVKALQELLLTLNYDLGKWGCDGDFGDCTELAVKQFQRDVGITADGICGTKTLEAILKAIDALDDEPEPNGKSVVIEGGDCYIRSEPDTDGTKLGVAKRGTSYPYGGETSEGGWQKILYTPAGGTQVTAWVSGKYGKLV